LSFCIYSLKKYFSDVVVIEIFSAAVFGTAKIVDVGGEYKL
jgi:hypothetical protein